MFGRSQVRIPAQLTSRNANGEGVDVVVVGRVPDRGVAAGVVDALHVDEGSEVVFVEHEEASATSVPGEHWSGIRIPSAAH